MPLQMVISSHFLSKGRRRICFRILARSQTAPPQVLPRSAEAGGTVRPSAVTSISISSFINVFRQRDIILLDFMIPARKSRLESVLCSMSALSSMVSSAAGRGRVCQAVYSAPSADPQGLWEHSDSPAADVTSQSQSKLGAFPPDLSRLFLVLWAYAALI